MLIDAPVLAQPIQCQPGRYSQIYVLVLLTWFRDSVQNAHTCFAVMARLVVSQVVVAIGDNLSNALSCFGQPRQGFVCSAPSLRRARAVFGYPLRGRRLPKSPAPKSRALPRYPPRSGDRQRDAGKQGCGYHQPNTVLQGRSACSRPLCWTEGLGYI